MEIIYGKNYEDMSEAAASLVVSAIKKKKNLLLCTATGNSPTGLYQQLVKAAKNKALFEAFRVLKLDEWGGVPDNHPVTCEHYLRVNLLTPLNIGEERYLSFSSNPPDLSQECLRVRAKLEKGGPIDVCILGLGKNGHIGFNEPATELEPFCHIARLSQESVQHTMVQGLVQKPVFGLTLGMQEILNSRKIILLVTGKGKKTIINRLLQGKISTGLPASLLWLHRQVTCIIDEQALA